MHQSGKNDRGKEVLWDDLYVTFDKSRKNKTFFKKPLDKDNKLW